MIADVDTALSTWLERSLPDGSRVAFDPPDESDPGPTVCLQLHDIREDPDGAPATQTTIRDANGMVSARRPAPRRYRLNYLITAWADGARAEHALLGAILTMAATTQALPVDCVGGLLLRGGYPVLVRCAPRERDLPTSAGWAGGLPARTGLEVTVLATLVPEAATGLAAAPERVDLRSAISPPPPPRAPRRPGPGIREGR